MRANEFIVENKATNKLMSLLVFLQSRASQEGAKPTLTMPSFLQMAQSLQIPLTYDSFDAVMQSNPNFSKLVSDYSEDKIVLNLPGDETTISSKADLDVEPTDAVDKMAKRALRKRT